MYKVIGLDTNFILSIIIERNNTKEALKLLSYIIENYEEIFIPQQVIAEIVYVLEGIYKYTQNQKKLSREEIKEYLLSVLNIPKVKIENEEVIFKALELYEAKKISFGDALIIGTLINKKIDKIVSFDKSFKNIKEIAVIDSLE